MRVPFLTRRRVFKQSVQTVYTVLMHRLKERDRFFVDSYSHGRRITFFYLDGAVGSGDRAPFEQVVVSSITLRRTKDGTVARQTEWLAYRTAIICPIVVAWCIVYPTIVILQGVCPSRSISELTWGSVALTSVLVAAWIARRTFLALRSELRALHSPLNETVGYFMNTSE